MVYSLTWLPQVLEAAGLKVAETPGWRTRGRAEMGIIRGVMCHHTATAAPGNMPSLNLLINGRSNLAGPLAQLGLGRDGTVYVIAAGRANHAGDGRWETITSGNSNFIGIEAENSGLPGDSWPAVQIDAYQRCVAAILKKIESGANMCCGHKEYALPTGRKPDPSFDMAPFRAAVADLLVGKTPPPPIPLADEDARPTVRRGDRSDWVKKVQTAINVSVDGDFSPGTEAAVRSFQRTYGLVPDGIVGPRTWAILDGPPKSAGHVQAPVSTLPPTEDAGQRPRVFGKQALGADGKVFASVVRSGFYTSGVTSLDTWLKSLPSSPVGASLSTVRVIRAISANEGRLEAINSYDNCFLSFGLFQWTAGQGADSGELAMLLTRFKVADPAAYADCLGKYGLEPKAAGPASMTGTLLLSGTELKSESQKSALRGVDWAWRFWRAGHHPAMRQAQFDMAVSRIDRFKTVTTAGRPLNTWLTSELGMALLLDQHVNRPSHVPDTLVTAITQLALEAADPTDWTTDNEDRLIDAYLNARSHTSMTDSDKRAFRISAFIDKGELSAVRGSFS